ncbi:YhgE/Pip domain-containing protein [Nonomuraea sp. NPDC050310]|uniref:YhgE/Pip domain-containing protein n=1 Tax=unclassified Nonomuraea TaxID=2593643 RepID=UPI0033FC29E3
MRVLDLALFELRRFRKPLQRAGLAFLLVVPLLYGAIYLWSNWDPYKKIDQVPVAVVNEDRPVYVDGKRIAGGEDFVQRLKEDATLQWHFVTAEEAARGQHDGRYYVIITVPPDFSEKLSSGADGAPQQAAMSIQLDDGNNYLVGVMAETVQAKLQAQINEAAVTTYFEAVVEGLEEAEKGFEELEDGARKLDRGAGSAAEGGRKLVEGTETLKRGSAALAPGARQVADGVDKLNAIAQPLAALAQRKLPVLADRANRIAQLASKITGIGAEGARGIARAAAAVSDLLHELCDEISWWIAEEKKKLGLPSNPDASEDFRLTPAMSAIIDSLLDFADFLALEAARLADAADQLDAEVKRVAADIAALRREVPALQRKIARGARDIQRLDDGARLVAKGAGRLDQGVGSLLDGTRQLSGGLDQLKDGTEQLVDGIEEGKAKIPSLDRSDAATLADPVEISKHNLHPAGAYGRGLAPFFIPIALWVFGIVAFLMLKPVSERALASGAPSPLVTAAAWLPVVGFGQVAAGVLYLVVDKGLGLAPVNVPGTLGLMSLGIATFVAIVQLVRIALGSAGDAVALLLLMVQLVSCGGLYPPETLPEPFATIHPLVPMTYLVAGLRVTISGGNPDITWHSVGLLCGFLAGALTLMLLVVIMQRRWTMERLKPSLEL